MEASSEGGGLRGCKTRANRGRAGANDMSGGDDVMIGDVISTDIEGTVSRDNAPGVSNRTGDGAKGVGATKAMGKAGPSKKQKDKSSLAEVDARLIGPTNYAIDKDLKHQGGT